MQPGHSLGFVALDGGRHVRRVADVGLAGLVNLIGVGLLGYGASEGLLGLLHVHGFPPSHRYACTDVGMMGGHL